MSSIKDTYSLKEIYKEVESKAFDIPTVQRGFVWKPHQIENLWDSLLRGYPVGAIVLTENEDKNKGKKTIQILDGQQRISSICLGLYKDNEASKEEVLGTSNENIKIFIDLAKPDVNDNRKYIFRVITRSHPWGYKRNDNKKTLKSNEIRDWIAECSKDETDIFDPKILAKAYPFDAIAPVPFSIFLSSKKEDEIISEVEKFLKNWGGKERIELKKQKKEDARYNIDIKERVKTILKDIEALDDLRIPALKLDLKKIHNQADSNSEGTKEETGVNEETEDNDSKNKDEIENMFIRLNSAGTPLSGEELNYSLLKGHMGKKTKKFIEDACKDMMKPSRFVTFAYRLWKQKGNKSERAFYRLQIKPKDFQRNMKDKKNREKFEEFVKNRITDILEKTKELLLYSDENKKGFPFLMVTRLAEKAPEVMFMILYRLMMEDKIEINSGIHTKMLGIVSLFSWLGTGQQKTGHQQLLRNIFPALLKLETESFWSSQVVERALITDENDNEVLTPFPKNNEILKYFDYLKKKHQDNKNNSKLKDGKIDNSIKKLVLEKELILFNQRGYLKEKFREELFLLDDTNVPFDWDHIFPQNWIKAKQGINKTLKEWYETNGNFWACSYEFNRMVHDDSPSEKFNNKNLKKEGVLKKDIYICDINKLNILQEDLKKNQKEVFYLILDRNKNLVKNWYEELMIDKLVKTKKMLKLKKYLSNQWDNAKDTDSNVFKKVNVGKDLSFEFFSDDVINEDKIWLGFTIPYKKIQNLKELDAEIENSDNKTTQIYKYFTLISNTDESGKILFKEMEEWLKEMSKNPAFSEYNLLDSFKNSLSKKL